MLSSVPGREKVQKTLIHKIIQQILITYYVLGTVLGVGNTAVSKTDKGLLSRSLNFTGGGRGKNKVGKGNEMCRSINRWQV